MESLKRVTSLNGVFAVCKPIGETSTQTLTRVKVGLQAIPKKVGGLNQKKAALIIKKQKKVGHGGTLDPMATGVLIIGLNDGCKRLSHYLKGCSKEYHATGRLGVHYDTYDTTGMLIEQVPYDHITEEAMKKILVEKFTGNILQRPPAFSALKINGKRAYDIARDRQKQLMTGNEAAAPPTVELEPRPTTISRIELTRFEPPEFEIKMECGSGTYVRSVIHDLGKELGSAAAMSALVRTMQGSFTLEDCLSVDDLSDIDKLEEALQKSKDKK